MANKRLNAIISIGGTVTGSLKSALGSTQARLKSIGSTIRELEREQKALGKTIAAGDLGAPIKQLEQRYKSLTDQIAKARREQERLKSAQAMKARGGEMMRSAGVTMGAAAVAVATVGYPIVQAAKFETAMLGVAKQVDGARDGTGKLTRVYFDMQKQIQAMGREIPLANAELAEMVASGARMGVARDELINFTRTAAMMASAFDLPAGELADSMGKIAGLFKIPIPAIGNLADSINYLDDNAISKGGDIIDFLTRTGGTAGAVKITGNEMAALGSTLLTLGERTETAGTATNAMLQKFAAADKGTKKFKSALTEIGLTTRDLQEGMQVDAQGTILKVMEAVNKLPAKARLGVLSDLVGLEHSDTLAKLSGNIEEYRRQIGLANSTKAKGSMKKEADAVANTAAGQLQLLKNRTDELAVNIGGVLLPSVNRLMGQIGGVVSGIADWARENPVLTKNIITFGGAIAGLIGGIAAVKFAVGAVTFAFGALKIAMMTNPVGLILGALAVGAVMIYNNWEPISAWWSGMWAGIKAVAAETWTVFKALLSWTPLGIIATNWGPISTFFSGLFAGIKSTVGAAIGWILGKIETVGKLWKSTKQVFGFGDEPGKPPAPPRGPGRAPPPVPRSRGGVAGAGAQSHNTFHITQQPGQSGKQLADDVVRRMDQRARTRAGNALFDTGA